MICYVMLCYNKCFSYSKVGEGLLLATKLDSLQFSAPEYLSTPRDSYTYVFYSKKYTLMQEFFSGIDKILDPLLGCSRRT